MARGWESKSVEAQQADAAEQASRAQAERLTPEQAAMRRQIEGLRLSRQRVLHQLETTQNTRLRSLLTEALASLDERLGKVSCGKSATQAD